ncbi:hypothetical protein Tco_0792243 [Tanacetum coccineum]
MLVILHPHVEVFNPCLQYAKTIKEQEDLIDTISDQLVEEKNTVKIKQTTISELEESLRKKDSENEHLKSKVVDFTTVQNLKVQIEELKSVNESLNLSVEELSKVHEKYCALKETESLKVEIKSLQTENKVLKSAESELSEKIDQMKSQVLELSEKLPISDQEMKQQIILFEEDKRILETKFLFLKHDNSLEKMIEMIEKEYESDVPNIFITSSTFETKNLELVKEMEDKMKCFDKKKNMFEDKISKLEKVLEQRVKDFDDVKIEL